MGKISRLRLHMDRDSRDWQNEGVQSAELDVLTGDCLRRSDGRSRVSGKEDRRSVKPIRRR